MSNIKELIRQEVERLFEKYQELEYRAERDCDDYDDDDIAFYQGKRKVCHEILSFLDTLPDEPEQPTKGYDEVGFYDDPDKEPICIIGQDEGKKAIFQMER